jgi:putative lipoprotein
MRSLFVSALTALTAVLPVAGLALAQEEMQPPLPLTIDFETQGCGRFRTVAYYRTEFQFVNVCIGEASLIMVVTDNDGLGRERVPVEKITTPDGVRFVGTSDRGIEYAIDNQKLTILFPGQQPYQEKVQKVAYTGLPQVKPVSQQPAKPMNTATVTGTVTYRQRIALPPNAIVKVQLRDVSRMDAPAILIDEQTISTNGKQVPIPFTLNYNSSQIQNKYSYAVFAEIWVDGKRQWMSTTRNAVISQGKPTENVTVVVSPISR